MPLVLRRRQSSLFGLKGGLLRHLLLRHSNRSLFLVQLRGALLHEVLVVVLLVVVLLLGGLGVVAAVAACCCELTTRQFFRLTRRGERFGGAEGFLASATNQLIAVDLVCVLAVVLG